MKKNSVITLVILGILVIGTILYFSFNNNSENKSSSNNTEEFYGFAQSLKNNYFPEVVIEKVEVDNLGGGKIQGYVKLDCSTLSVEKKQELVESFANLLYSEYPEHFGENAIYDSWTDIYCSDGGWRIAGGIVQPLLY